ncbi:MAG: hypothetical protein ABII01_02165 [Candidatus Woesearchaeota archaeon]
MKIRKTGKPPKRLQIRNCPPDPRFRGRQITAAGLWKNPLGFGSTRRRKAELEPVPYQGVCYLNPINPDEYQDISEQVQRVVHPIDVLSQPLLCVMANMLAQSEVFQPGKRLKFPEREYARKQIREYVSAMSVLELYFSRHQDWSLQSFGRKDSLRIDSIVDLLDSDFFEPKSPYDIVVMNPPSSIYGFMPSPEELAFESCVSANHEVFQDMVDYALTHKDKLSRLDSEVGLNENDLDETDPFGTNQKLSTAFTQYMNSHPDVTEIEKGCIERFFRIAEIVQNAYESIDSLNPGYPAEERIYETVVHSLAPRGIVIMASDSALPIPGLRIVQEFPAAVLYQNIGLTQD